MVSGDSGPKQRGLWELGAEELSMTEITVAGCAHACASRGLCGPEQRAQVPSPWCPLAVPPSAFVAPTRSPLHRALRRLWWNSGSSQGSLRLAAQSHQLSPTGCHCLHFLSPCSSATSVFIPPSPSSLILLGNLSTCGEC